MSIHRFLLEPGTWLGEGKVTFSASPEQLHFFTRWEASDNQGGIITCKQLVEMREPSESIHNNYFLSAFTGNKFTIELNNEILGMVLGQGIIDGKTIAWEFRRQENFEGFEVYELQSTGDYLLHAEYSSPEQFRTIIDARIWSKFQG